MSGTLESFRRPLEPAEMRVLRAKIGSLSARGRRSSRAYLPITAVAILALWLLTLLVSDTPWPVITIFWVIVGGGLALWMRRDMRNDAGQFEAMARRLESALRRNLADVSDVRAKSFVELEEIEDEGACYAFELEDGRLVFISGQEFYPVARFPSLDFSLVYVLDENGQAVDMLIEKRGARATPSRVIPAATKRRLAIPDHLETLSGPIDRLEHLLSPAARMESPTP